MQGPVLSSVHILIHLTFKQNHVVGTLIILTYKQRLGLGMSSLANVTQEVNEEQEFASIHISPPRQTASAGIFFGMERSGCLNFLVKERVRN